MATMTMTLDEAKKAATDTAENRHARGGTAVRYAITVLADALTAAEARVAALEAAAKRTADCDHHEDCPGAYDEHGDVAEDDDADSVAHCVCGVGWSRNAISGGTAALDAHVEAATTPLRDLLREAREAVDRGWRFPDGMPEDWRPLFVRELLAKIDTALAAAKETT